jgi:hypothetical protein
MTPDTFLLDFIDKHYLLVVSSSIVGLFATIKRAGSYIARTIMTGLHRFPELHRAFYERRTKCAENKCRFENALRIGIALLRRGGLTQHRYPLQSSWRRFLPYPCK